MESIRRRHNRRTIALLPAVATVGAIGIGIAPAAASTAPAAHLLMKGVGTNYSRADDIHRSATLGQTLTYYFEAVNDSDATRQYLVRMFSCSTTATHTCITSSELFVGSTRVPPSLYITPPIQPGQATAFTVQIATKPGVA